MATAKKSYYACVQCGKKTSTTNTCHARTYLCGSCRAALAAANARDAERAAQGRKAAGTAQTPPAAAGGALTALAAAAAVLAAATEPLRVKPIVGLIFARRLCDTLKGATPDQTIGAAINRDIVEKGDASRFVKVKRGLYAARRHA